MERTSDFEQLLFLYKTEGKGISLEQFCINNGINYRAFDRWYRNHHEGVVPVQVVGTPKQLEQFLLEEGLTDYSKRIVADLLARMGCDTETKTEANNKKVHDELSGIFSRVLDDYISDYPTENICDKYVVSHVVKAIVNSGLEELSDQLKTVYSQDMVDKKICGELDTNLSVMKDLGCADLNYIETGIYPLMFLPTYLIWDNADSPDFGEQ